MSIVVDGFPLASSPHSQISVPYSTIMMLLYTAGIYLMLAGTYSLMNVSDFYIGF